MAEKPTDPFDGLFQPFDLEGGPPPEQRSSEMRPPERQARPAAPRNGGQPAGARNGGQPPGGVPCPSCGTYNPPTNRHCEACGARLSQVPLPVAPQPLLRTTAGARALMVLAGVILTVAVLALLVNLFRSNGGPVETTATSTATSTTLVPPDVIALTPVEVDCSSEFPDYPCKALWDDNPDNRWNAENGGVDATITFFFSPRVQITEVVIRNISDQEAFLRNARVKGIEIEMDDLEQATIVELADINDPQPVELRSVRTSTVKITIASAYPGQSFQGQEAFRELAIQEIVFYGRLSPEASG